VQSLKSCPSIDLAGWRPRSGAALAVFQPTHACRVEDREAPTNSAAAPL
jgi:hypothetical protein